MNCRHCRQKLINEILDLGHAPPSNNYLTKQNLSEPEYYFPLKLLICEYCWLVQTVDYNEPKDLFREDYAYLSSVTASWLKHAENYVDLVIKRFSIDKESYVVEIGSNDGYLLKNFLMQNIPCLGVEPTAIAAEIARKQGIVVNQDFFSEKLAIKIARNKKKADLIIINNVLAHVPNLHDFVHGIKVLLKESGVCTVEIPHLLKLIEDVQFDTVYHEHYSYFTLSSVNRVFRTRGLTIFDVEEISTHGGSLRLYICHDHSDREVSRSVINLLDIEDRKNLNEITPYKNFQVRVDEIKHKFMTFLLNAKKEQKSIAGYGAAAKGNTLINYSGIKRDLLPVIYDAAESKQGKYLPGSHIPIKSPVELLDNHPDYLIIFPWNIKDEIISEYKNKLSNQTKFVTLIPNFCLD